MHTPLQVILGLAMMIAAACAVAAAGIVAACLYCWVLNRRAGD